MAVWCKKLGYYVIYGITNYNFVWGVCVYCVCLSQSLAHYAMSLDQPPRSVLQINVT